MSRSASGEPKKAGDESPPACDPSPDAEERVPLASTLEFHTMNTSPMSELLAAYRDGPASLRRTVSDMTTEQLRARPVAGKWSTLEVVCHLVDSEQAWCHRMKLVIAEENPLILSYDDTRFTAALAYHAHDLEEELTLVDCMRKQMTRLLAGLSVEAWSRTCVHSECGLMTLMEMVKAEVDHFPHHIRHIGEKRAALGLVAR
jgi:hypothetical protein